ncbi:MAG: (Na+)-NQR maturation NqrM [Spirochaetales bacterium]|nr:(Na+)-NQR maturation NqrM [Spirochaetales bacterium]
MWGAFNAVPHTDGFSENRKGSCGGFAAVDSKKSFNCTQALVSGTSYNFTAKAKKGKVEEAKKEKNRIE